MFPLVDNLFSDMACNVDGENNVVWYKKYHAVSSRIVVKGSNNTIVIGNEAKLEDAHIIILSNNNTLRIGSHVWCRGAIRLQDGDRNFVEIGDCTRMGRMNLYCAEGTKTIIGKKCMFSAVIEMRTGDGHSIFDQQSGVRINPAQDIIIGDHVWLGMNSTILKGTTIGKESMVAANSLVAGKAFPEHCIIGGVPAKVLRNDIQWDSRVLSSLPAIENT